MQLIADPSAPSGTNPCLRAVITGGSCENLQIDSSSAMFAQSLVLTDNFNFSVVGASWKTDRLMLLQDDYALGESLLLFLMPEASEEWFAYRRLKSPINMANP